jgi:hypothetical protein
VLSSFQGGREQKKQQEKEEEEVVAGETHQLFRVFGGEEGRNARRDVDLFKVDLGALEEVLPLGDKLAGHLVLGQRSDLVLRRGVREEGQQSQPGILALGTEEKGRGEREGRVTRTPCPISSMIFSKSFLFSASSFDRVRISTSTCSPDLGAVKSGCKSLAAGRQEFFGGSARAVSKNEARPLAHQGGGASTWACIPLEDETTK